MLFLTSDVSYHDLVHILTLWCLYLTDLYGNNDDNNDHNEDVIGVINSTPFTEKGVK